MASAETPAWTAPYRLAVAVRLLRARKINLISIVGVMLGVGSIIVVMSVMDGFQVELREMIRGTLSDVIVEFDSTLVPRVDEIRAAVEAVPGVEAAALQQHTVGVIPVKHRGIDGGGQTHMALRVVGIRPGEECRVSRVMTHMEPERGQPDDPFEIVDDFVPEDMPRVVISRWTAKRLHREVGDRFTLITFEEVQKDGEEQIRANSRWVVVSRIYSSGNSEFDKLHIYVDGRAGSTGEVFFRTPDATIAELRVKLKDYRDADALRQPIADAVGRYDLNVLDAPRWYVETWEERQANLLKAVNNEKFLLAFVLFFIVVVACFTIFATLTMTVVEKTRDIGVLRALGATPGGILSIFMLNGTLVGTLGAGLGYVLGMLVATNVNPIRGFLRDTFGWEIFPPDIYLFDNIPTHIDHPAVLRFAVGACLSALVFAIIPAVRAARLRPVRALRYE
ncbi:MAG TPA: ABC transporter permease [Planctomycetota bacterium]|nr:ABC transporter permease [Planctomycetota bacterium]